MTGASEELCYFCREHEMRPLRTGKQGEKGGGDIQGAFRLLALTRGKSLETTPRLVFSGGVARWFQMHAHSPGSRLQLCPRHLSSGRKTMRWEGRGHETGDWEGGGGGDRGRDLLKHWDRKRDLWISSFSSLQLLVSPSHVMCNSRKDRSAFVSRNGGGVLSVPPLPQRLLIAHSRVGTWNNSHTFGSVRHMSAGSSKSLYRASDTDDYEVSPSCMRQRQELCGRFLLNCQNGQIETRWEFMMFVTLQTANKATFSGSKKSCISQMLRALRAGWINKSIKKIKKTYW